MVQLPWDTKHLKKSLTTQADAFVAQDKGQLGSFLSSFLIIILLDRDIFDSLQSKEKEKEFIYIMY